MTRGNRLFDLFVNTSATVLGVAGVLSPIGAVALWPESQEYLTPMGIASIILALIGISLILRAGKGRGRRRENRMISS